ncbi:hypothetical protein [Pendulispora rubella]|uniref:hypothetical protein n=1 Tax=Pendulispora rubella TaxID=2741070 RepID=UPI00374E0C69
MKLQIVCLLGFHALVGCSADGGAPTQNTTPLDESRGSVEHATTAAATKFSNLPADICSTPGTKDFNVAAGTSAMLGDEVPCDAIVSQGDGLHDICVYKFSKVTVAGFLALQGASRPDPFSSPPPSTRAVAIVATTSFTVEGAGAIHAQGDGERNGAGAPDGSGGGGYLTGSGAGHVTEGAPGGRGGAPGAAYGPTSGAQLVGGSGGGEGHDGFDRGGEGGRGGGAVQIASCGTLHLAGSIAASGGDGWSGGSKSGAGASGGGGGGSGGTVVVEAAEVTGSGRLSAIGGNGGLGGCVVGPGGTFDGCGPAGAGGTGARAPQAGGPGTVTGSGYAGGDGGGGGSIGRVVINVAASCGGTPAITSDPPATIGTLPN